MRKDENGIRLEISTSENDSCSSHEDDGDTKINVSISMNNKQF